MKDKLLQALKTKFNGVNANVLNRIADYLSKTVQTDEEVTTAVEGVTQEYINMIVAYGDSRATESQKTAVQNYENKYGLKDGVKVNQQPTGETKPNSTEQQTDAVAEALQQLIEQNRKLTERLDRMDGERTAASRKSEFESIISRLPDINRKAYERISLETLSDDEFTNLKSEVAGEVDAIMQSEGAKGAVFGTPKTGASRRHQPASVKEATDDEAKAVVDKLHI